MDNSGLLINLVIALTAALGGALIAARLGQSVILGYILAGVAIGPYTPGLTGDIDTVEALAEIGVILLMFAIGVQFSLRDLLQAGRIATIGGLIQVLVILGLGTLVGMALGWSLIEALFFGAVISNSSSTVLTKVLGERGEMATPPGQLALAWSTVQDLSTVILIVILSALATDSDALLRDLLWEVGKAGIFLVLLVPVGLRMLPWMFNRVAEIRNREVFVLTVAGVALGLAFSASLFGLSLALGAFVAGVVVSESDLSHQILGEILPLRDIFAGLFFVSVGMLVDPGFVLRNMPLLLITLALIVIVKGGLVAILAWVLGTPTRTAVLTGAILAQSAEFSFLLARVGSDVGAVSGTVFSLMLAGAAASIVMLPAVYRGAQPLAVAVSNRRPSVRHHARPPSAPEPDPGLSGHAVICGYGRVGQAVGQVTGRRFAVVAIEEDPRLVRRLREQGVRVVQGNAAVAAVLEQANPARARVLVLALPDPVATRQIVSYVRERYPHVDIVVRTHSEAERRFLLTQGVNEVVLGEWELALEMTRHTLQRFGISTLEAQQIIHRLRARVEPELWSAAPPKVTTRRPDLAQAKPAPEVGGAVDIQRHRDAVAENMGDRPDCGIGGLGAPDPGPAIGRGDTVDFAQPETEPVQRTGSGHEVSRAAEHAVRSDEDGEAHSEESAQRQVNQRSRHHHRSDQGSRFERPRSVQERGSQAERTDDN